MMATKQDIFIEKVKDGAIAGWHAGKILPSVTIAQACLESKWGESELATKAYNLFGIKAKNGWKGESYTVRTAEYDENNKQFFINAPFRKYDSWKESLIDHAKFFHEDWREVHYSTHGVIGQTDYKKACKGLQSAGYATSKIYADQLMGLIEMYKLYKYDDVIKESEVKGMKIFLSVGHSILKGGSCTSAVGYTHEYRYNKELAPYIKEELESRGHKCDVIICPERAFPSKEGEYSYKIPKANGGGYDLVCELHLNASDGAGHGVEVFYYPGDKKGNNIASYICKNISSLGFTNRGPLTGQLYMINDTRPTAVLVESFFCDNRQDSNLASQVGFKKMAVAIACGLLQEDCNSKANTSISDTNMKVGWVEESEQWYYYDKGKKRTGWLKSGSKWFYLDPEKDGAMVTGWLEYNHNKFYFNSKGYCMTGKQVIDGKTYEFDKDGYLIK